MMSPDILSFSSSGRLFIVRCLVDGCFHLVDHFLRKLFRGRVLLVFGSVRTGFEGILSVTRIRRSPCLSRSVGDGMCRDVRSDGDIEISERIGRKVSFKDDFVWMPQAHARLLWGQPRRGFIEPDLDFAVEPVGTQGLDGRGRDCESGSSEFFATRRFCDAMVVSLAAEQSLVWAFCWSRLRRARMRSRVR